MRGAASKGGPLEEVIPETWGASAQVQSPGAHLLSCLLRHSVFLEALALHTYLPLPSTSSHPHPNPGGKEWTEKRVQRKPSMQIASRWHLSASSVWPWFPRGDLPVLKMRCCSIHAASLNGSCVLPGTLLKPQGLRAGTKGPGGLQASTDLGRGGGNVGGGTHSSTWPG